MPYQYQIGRLASRWNQEKNDGDGDAVEEREELKWAKAVLIA